MNDGMTNGVYVPLCLFINRARCSSYHPYQTSLGRLRIRRMTEIRSRKRKMDPDIRAKKPKINDKTQHEHRKMHTSTHVSGTNATKDIINTHDKSVRHIHAAIHSYSLR
jgi:hypothetical protein